MAREQKVQISMKLFADLFLYFVGPSERRTPEQEERITRQIREKYDLWYNHIVFTSYRQAATDAERLKFLSEYLDRTGVNPDFRVLLRKDQEQAGAT